MKSSLEKSDNDAGPSCLSLDELKRFTKDLAPTDSWVIRYLVLRYSDPFFVETEEERQYIDSIKPQLEKLLNKHYMFASHNFDEEIKMLKILEKRGFDTSSIHNRAIFAKLTQNTNASY